jgi:hypothetical protein
MSAIHHMGGCTFHFECDPADTLGSISVDFTQTNYWQEQPYDTFGEFLAMRPDASNNNLMRYRDPDFTVTATEYATAPVGGILYQLCTN